MSSKLIQNHVSISQRNVLMREQGEQEDVIVLFAEKKLFKIIFLPTETSQSKNGN